MPYFGSLSTSRLATCHPHLQEIMNEVIKTYDCSITWGWRGEDAQNAAFAVGASNVCWPNSNHNHYTVIDGKQIPCSLAVDFRPYPPDPPEKEDRARYALIAGFAMRVGMELGYPVRWGGDWNCNGCIRDENLQDLGHIELVL